MSDIADTPQGQHITTVECTVVTSNPTALARGASGTPQKTPVHITFNGGEGTFTIVSARTSNGTSCTIDVNSCWVDVQAGNNRLIVSPTTHQSETHPFPEQNSSCSFVLRNENGGNATNQIVLEPPSSISAQTLLSHFIALSYSKNTHTLTNLTFGHNTTIHNAKLHINKVYPRTSHYIAITAARSSGTSGEQASPFPEGLATARSVTVTNFGDANGPMRLTVGDTEVKMKIDDPTSLTEVQQHLRAATHPPIAHAYPLGQTQQTPQLYGTSHGPNGTYGALHALSSQIEHAVRSLGGRAGHLVISYGGRHRNRRGSSANRRRSAKNPTTRRNGGKRPRRPCSKAKSNRRRRQKYTRKQAS